MKQQSLTWQLPTEVDATPGQMLQRYFEVTNGSETILALANRLRTQTNTELVKLGMEFWMVGVGLISTFLRYEKTTPTMQRLLLRKYDSQKMMEELQKVGVLENNSDMWEILRQLELWRNERL